MATREDPLIEQVKAKGEDWYCDREGLMELTERSKPSINRYVKNGQIAYDMSRGRRKLFSKNAVLKFLREHFCAVGEVAS